MAWERQTRLFCRVWALSCVCAWVVAASLEVKCNLHKVQVNLGFSNDVASLANNWHSCWTDFGELSVKRRNFHGFCLTSKLTFGLVGTEKSKSYGWIFVFKYMKEIKLVWKQVTFICVEKGQPHFLFLLLCWDLSHTRNDIQFIKLFKKMSYLWLM